MIAIRLSYPLLWGILCTAFLGCRGPPFLPLPRATSLPTLTRTGQGRWFQTLFSKGPKVPAQSCLEVLMQEVPRVT